MKKFTVFITLTFFLTAALFAQQKYALVIGNSNYKGISKLTNPANDANDMAATLQSLGFTVDKILDGDLERMETAVTNLKRKLGASRNSYGFFFFAGHGVQANGQNYLIPLPANNILNETHLRDRAVSLQFVLDSLSEAGNELNMIVLDACRDNPFGWSRSGTRGLSLLSNAPSGSIVMYAAASGQKADDGSGRNGLFTGYLLNNLKTTGLSVYEVFDKTMGDVKNITGGKQDPELSLRFSGANTVYLGSRPTPNAPAQPAVQPQPQPSVTGGSVTVESEIAGEIFIDGQTTGRRIKAGGTETISNVSTGSTEVAVKDGDGTIVKASTVMVRQGQTVKAVIERPIPEGLAFEIVDGKSVIITKYSGTAATMHIPEKIQGLPVTVIGRNAFWYCETLSNVTIPSSVTTIEGYAFSGCNNLTRIIIPSSVTSIDKQYNPFILCESLSEITVDRNNPAYTSVDGVIFDKKIQTIIKYPQGKKANAYNIPSSITTIGDGAFHACGNLTSISIPSSVTTIESSAFISCGNLTSISIPSSVTSIGNYAFDSCGNLTSITVDSRNTLYSSVGGVLFDKNVRTLHRYPAGKTASTYTIPSSVTTIGYRAFFDCGNLTSISIPSSVTTIESSAFFYCSNLTGIFIPSSVTSIIVETAFDFCGNLTSITVDSRNTLYSSVDGVLFDKNVRTLYRYPDGRTASTYTIPSSVTTIGIFAFYSCSNLTRISIPSSVTTIGSSAFISCSNLTSISIPSSVTTIGSYAFYSCGKLTSVTLSRKTQVGEEAFPETARIKYSD